MVFVYGKRIIGDIIEIKPDQNCDDMNPQEIVDIMKSKYYNHLEFEELFIADEDNNVYLREKWDISSIYGPPSQDKFNSTISCLIYTAANIKKLYHERKLGTINFKYVKDHFEFSIYDISVRMYGFEIRLACIKNLAHNPAPIIATAEYCQIMPFLVSLNQRQ